MLSLSCSFHKHHQTSVTSPSRLTRLVLQLSPRESVSSHSLVSFPLFHHQSSSKGGQADNHHLQRRPSQLVILESLEPDQHLPLPSLSCASCVFSGHLLSLQHTQTTHSPIFPKVEVCSLWIVSSIPSKPCCRSQYPLDSIP